jgi:hypothetical protein
MIDAMSAIGTKRTHRVALHMSAFGGKADMARTCPSSIRRKFLIQQFSNVGLRLLVLHYERGASEGDRYGGRRFGEP